jgi:hypothetical protein
MTALLHRRLIETEDWLRYQPGVRDLVGRYKAWRELRRAPGHPQDIARSIRNLCSVARLLRDPTRIRQIEERIAERVRQLDPRRVDWSEFVPQLDNRNIARGVIIKPHVGPREKGIVYIGCVSCTTCRWQRSPSATRWSWRPAPTRIT